MNVYEVCEKDKRKIVRKVCSIFAMSYIPSVDIFENNKVYKKQMTRLCRNTALSNLWSENIPVKEHRNLLFIKCTDKRILMLNLQPNAE